MPDDADPEDDTDPDGDVDSEEGTDTETARLADRPPGFDEENPYQGEALEKYPGWWRENVDAFREHGMRPYRPPQFADGTLVPEHLSELEAELGVEIRLRKHIGADTDTSWRVVVDGEVQGRIDRVRTEEGRSVYTCSSGEFEVLVRDASAEEE